MKDNQKKSVTVTLDPVEAPRFFLAYLMRDSEALKNFVKFYDEFIVYMPYLNVVDNAMHKNTIEGWEAVSIPWNAAVDRLVVMLKPFLSDKKLSALGHFLKDFVLDETMKKHLVPRTGNVNFELFNRKTFAVCICWIEQEFDLFEGSRCWNRAMSMTTLAKLALGYNPLDESKKDCDRLFDNDEKSDANITNIFTHKTKETPWITAMLVKARKYFV